MPNPSNAAKAFIIKDNKLLLLKRRPNDPHRPGQWDIPGGRLNLGESPYLGLKRECQEEISCEIDIILPLDVHYFTRDDGQQITLMIFFCRALTDKITLSEEHTEYRWVDINAAKNEFPAWIQPVVEKFLFLKPDASG